MVNIGQEEELCLHELFERQARLTPREPAVIDASATLTYEELDKLAERLAGYLRGAGIGPDGLAGVYMERRAEYVVACLAALKAGGAFLPLELAYPDALLHEVIADSEPGIVLTRGPLADRLPSGQRRLCMDEGWERALPEADYLPQARGGARPENLAFVSYSSGTTGRPKGIANPHRAAVSSYLWRFGIRDYGPGDRVGCNVFFIWEMLRPLLRGATTVVIPDDVIYDPPALVEFLAEQKVTEVLLTPSLLEALLDASEAEVGGRLSSLRSLWLNGEVVTKNLARRAQRALPGVRLLNVYSISETHEVAAGDLRENPAATYCPVGHPMDPEHLYVLDEQARPVPAGEAGELYVGGCTLARGYVNLPELTSQRFTEDPFAAGGRMYRTGDRARLLPDGSLEVLGRTDFMVKVRGYSIELGAVEAAIEKHLAVKNCVVVAEGEEGEDKRLVAYLVPGAKGGERFANWRIDPGTGRSPEIRRRLQESLPHYMIPAVFVEVEALPLQESTGKVDRAHLPPPPPRAASGPRSDAELRRAASGPEKESALARIWEDILGLEEGDVRPEDDFFDVGGHSLAAAESLGRVEEVFGVRLPMRVFLENPTVERVCGEIEALQRGGGGGRAPRQDVDLRAEAVLDPDIVAHSDGKVVTLREAGRVLLTGATGFLGAFLLDTLLSRTSAEVHCLVRPRPGAGPASALRSTLDRYGLWRPETAGRVVPVAGDLERQLLGLPEGEFDALAREMDLIIHAAAVVNMVFPYSLLRSANVDGTREVLRLASLHGAKPVHHISTSGIFPPGERRCEEDVDLDELAEAREDGYGQSKWVAERLVWEAAERGLPVSVYRPGNISGHSATGVSNPRDLLGALIAGSLRLGRAPRIEGWRMEMTPVDFVSAAICHLAGETGALGRAFHLADPDPPPAETVFDWLEEAGYPTERVGYPDWLEAVRADPRREHEGNDVLGTILGDGGPGGDELWEGNIYDDRNTRRLLSGSGLRRPQIDAPLLGRYASYFAGRDRAQERRAVAHDSPA